MLDLDTWEGFRSTFQLPILMSLLGGLIGHFAKKQTIELPYMEIMYQRGSFLQGCKWYLFPIRCLTITLEFLIYMLGFRIGINRSEGRTWMYPGFLGDLLVGVGAGILAKSALLSINPKPNDDLVITASLLAGFAGLSYIHSLQTKDLSSAAPSMADDLKGAPLEGSPTTATPFSSPAAVDQVQAEVAAAKHPTE